MKNLLLGVLFGILLVLVPLSYTQQQERISVGTASLQLGMEKDTVISKMKELGYEFTKGPVAEGPMESWIVTEKNERTGDYDIIVSLWFKGRRLVMASRPWANSWESSSAKIGKNLYILTQIS